MGFKNEFIKKASALLLAAGFAVLPLKAYAEDFTYTTEGGTWIPVQENADGTYTKVASSNLYAIKTADDKTSSAFTESSGKPVILLEMNGNQWQFKFIADGAGGLDYYVTEKLTDQQSSQDYKLVDENGQPVMYVKIPAGSTEGTLTNREDYPQGTLTLSKTVYDPGSKADPDEEFPFTITLSNEDSSLLSGQKVLGDTLFTDGKANISLKSGESVTFDKIPANTSYSILEVPPEGYRTYVYQGDAAKEPNPAWNILTLITGTVAANQNEARSYRNVIKADDPDAKEGEYQDLEIAKIVNNGKQEAFQSSFSFTASFTDLQPGQVYSMTGAGKPCFWAEQDGSASVNFKMADGQSVVFEQLPAGSKYQIHEDAAQQYYPSYQISGENLSLQNEKADGALNTALDTAIETVDSGENAKVTFTNRNYLVPAPGCMFLTLNKVWNDKNDFYGERPDSATIEIWRKSESDPDGEKVDETMLNKDSALKDDANTWSYVFENLPLADESGNEYTYFAKETGTLPPHYEVQVSNIETDPDDSQRKTLTVTNAYILNIDVPETGDRGIIMAVAGGLLILCLSLTALLISKRRNL